MRRIDALEAIYPLLEDRIVVTNMGAAAVELYSLGHRESFFYLEHAMGLASSIGLGLALCLPDHPVVVVDGDGSVLMNLGGLSTLARYRPPNLVHVIFDNESLLSVGGFPTATSTGTDLAQVARGSGVEHVESVSTLEDLKGAFSRAMERGATSVIVAKVEAVGPPGFAMDVGLLENRFQFQRYIKGLRAGQ
jgi:sulfopyruvate decarboxylase subunit beta